MHKLNVEGFLEIIFKMYIIKKIVDRDEVSLSLHLLIHINSGYASFSRFTKINIIINMVEKNGCIKIGIYHIFPNITDSFINITGI